MKVVESRTGFAAIIIHLVLLFLFLFFFLFMVIGREPISLAAYDALPPAALTGHLAARDAPHPTVLTGASN